MFETFCRITAVALFLAALAAGLAACASQVPAGALPAETASAVLTEATAIEPAVTQAPAIDDKQK